MERQVQRQTNDENKVGENTPRGDEHKEKLSGALSAQSSTIVIASFKTIRGSDSNSKAGFVSKCDAACHGKTESSSLARPLSHCAWLHSMGRDSKLKDSM
mmetsp:Transcript_18865/g.57002  ORF Transcript_18865/g.57002 Transcript_18865/m.57002 type:complete len:100 (+) Transcript_18865:157-456(+)